MPLPCNKRLSAILVLQLNCDWEIFYFHRINTATPNLFYNPVYWPWIEIPSSHKKQKILIEGPQNIKAKEITCLGWEVSRLWCMTISNINRWWGHSKQWIINDLMKIHRREAESKDVSPGFSNYNFCVIWNQFSWNNTFFVYWKIPFPTWFFAPTNLN